MAQQTDTCHNEANPAECSPIWGHISGIQIRYWLITWQSHDDIIKWKHFPRYWSPVNSLHKGQWRGALIFSLICARTNAWVNDRETGDLRHHRPHYDVIVLVHLLTHIAQSLDPWILFMKQNCLLLTNINVLSRTNILSYSLIFKSDSIQHWVVALFRDWKIQNLICATYFQQNTAKWNNETSHWYLIAWILMLIPGPKF